MSTWGYLGLQDAASPLMEQLIYFHDHAMVVIIMIVSFVGYMMLSLFSNKYIHRFLLENQYIEIVWTIIPAVILVFIALPSLRLLYLLDEVGDPVVTLKVIGHQWYWTYEYTDFYDIEFDSYLLFEDELYFDEFRLLDVDNSVVLPVNVPIRVLVTAGDVIHSWTVPALGVKADAIPGRLNQVSFEIDRPGSYFGQCSEICGANHSFMPIMVEGVEVDLFCLWATFSDYFIDDFWFA